RKERCTGESIAFGPTQVEEPILHPQAALPVAEPCKAEFACTQSVKVSLGQKPGPVNLGKFPPSGVQRTVIRIERFPNSSVDDRSVVLGCESCQVLSRMDSIPEKTSRDKQYILCFA